MWYNIGVPMGTLGCLYYRGVEVSWDVLPSGKTLDVIINSIGPDLEERLAEIAEQESMYSVKTTLYYLNMNDPGRVSSVY